MEWKHISFVRTVRDADVFFHAKVAKCKGREETSRLGLLDDKIFS